MNTWGGVNLIFGIAGATGNFIAGLTAHLTGMAVRGRPFVAIVLVNRTA
jgi:hypothetical protein